MLILAELAIQMFCIPKVVLYSKVVRMAATGQVSKVTRIMKSVVGTVKRAVLGRRSPCIYLPIVGAATLLSPARLLRVAYRLCYTQRIAVEAACPAWAGG